MPTITPTDSQHRVAFVLSLTTPHPATHRSVTVAIVIRRAAFIEVEEIIRNIFRLQGCVPRDKDVLSQTNLG